MKLLIISHTSHYEQSEEIVGFSPTVSEINYLSKYFSSIIHLAVLHKNIEAPKNTIKYSSKNIRFIPIKPFGGETLKNKLSIISSSISALFIIQKHLREVDLFQFRAPTSIGVLLIPYLSWFSKKNGWFKYAGNWSQKKPPISYKFQKSVLTNNKKHKVTINGRWDKQPEHCLSFENPCLYEEDQIIGEIITKNKKTLPPYEVCFVGALNDEKGVSLILDCLEKFPDELKIKTIHFAGDGNKKTLYEKRAKSINVNIKFYGNLNRASVFKLYEKCHFILLPSKSEGFPKVIAEAANFGCIALVSAVSSIPQYIKNGKTGFLWRSKNISFDHFLKNTLTQNKPSDFKKIQSNAYSMSKKFTFSNYLTKLKKQVLEI